MNKEKKRPRGSHTMSLELSSLNPEHIMEQAEWLGIPLDPDDVKKFLKNLETVVFKFLDLEYENIQVSYTQKYSINDYNMMLQLQVSLEKITIGKQGTDENWVHEGHIAYCKKDFSWTNYTKKKGVIPLKTLPLLINHESPTIRLLAKAKLQGLL